MFCPGDKRRASHPQEFTQPFFFSQFIFVSRLTNLGNSNTYKHLRDAEKDDKAGSKSVAGHFNLLNHSTSRKHGKPQNSRTIFFLIGTLNPHGINKCLSPNLLSCFLRYHGTNKQRSSIFLYINHTEPTIPRSAPMKGERSKTSAFQSLYDAQFTLSTQLIKADYLAILPNYAAPQFLQKLTSFVHLGKEGPTRNQSSHLFRNIFHCILECSDSNIDFHRNWERTLHRFDTENLSMVSGKK